MAVTETRVLPPEFIEAAGKTYLSDLATAAGDFKTADLSKVFGPQFVAGQDPLQAQAQQIAQQGIGAYKPFLQSASALTGPTAFRQFMSPYQQDVIDTTLKEFDTQAAKGLPALAAQAINAGAFGGGREGVQRAEDTGREYEDVLNELYQTEIRRKSKSEEDIARDDTISSIDSIIETTRSRTGAAKLDKIQGEILFDNLQTLKSSSPDDYEKFVGGKSTKKYIFGSDEFDRDTGTIKEQSKIRNLPDEFIVYDINTGTFLKKQGNRLIGLE